MECAVYEDAEYLVNGDNPVSDAQISASSVWDNDPGHGSKGARLYSTPSLTTVGAWAAGYSNANQYIQVQFNGLSHVMGVAIQGRPVNTDPSFEYLGCCSQRVTSYKLIYSYDCAYFLTIKDCNGSDRIFVGNTDENTVVTTMLPSPVAALCVKINPVTWFEHISMRFDILGNSIN
ncbi:inactive carboxypeptidase-like protein X2 [Mya arenaria]|uniref:inactive carboxypeptidase-like protein X2 n=1 Tax=Mya arenaria TaxID=6604 RepID=UPI0022E678BD|nr:inactive carboxypeptidase-like protein X2 [Mya arenaria]